MSCEASALFVARPQKEEEVEGDAEGKRWSSLNPTAFELQAASGSVKSAQQIKPSKKKP